MRLAKQQDAKTKQIIRRGREAFRWQIPERYNLGVDVCDKFANITPNAPALIDILGDGSPRPYSYLKLKRLSNHLANTLLANGLSAGDRVGIILPQCPKLLSHILPAIKLVSSRCPCSRCSARMHWNIASPTAGPPRSLPTGRIFRRSTPSRGYLNDLRLILSVNGMELGIRDFHALLPSASDAFTPVNISAEDPAFLIFISGTTGPPKGALHAHQTLLGHFPGVQFMHDFFQKRAIYSGPGQIEPGPAGCWTYCYRHWLSVNPS
jgi:acetyl-CoA synthetase